ncbi:MAG: DUF5674 family protein [bacterium]
MEIITNPIPRSKLLTMAQQGFGNFVKGVVDIEQEIIAVDAELHADQEAELLKNGSQQANLWGINLYPEIETDDWIEFDSMINLRPTQNNKTRGVDSPEIRTKICEIVNKLVRE